MLAVLPEREARAAFATAAGSGSGETLREFHQRLATVRERGWAEEVEEVARGQRSIAVAVLDHLQRPAAALAVTFPVGRFSESQVRAAVENLQRNAQLLSERMYGARTF